MTSTEINKVKNRISKSQKISKENEQPNGDSKGNSNNDEVKVNENIDDRAISLAKISTNLQMHNNDIIQAVIDLYAVYSNVKLVAERFGLTEANVKKIIRETHPGTTFDNSTERK